MRDTQGLDPMWENDAQRARGSRVIGVATGAVKAVASRVAPHLLNWASAQRPQVVVAWGLKEYRLRRDGIISGRREGPEWGDNPRRNYNEAVQKRQEKAAEAQPSEPPTAAVVDEGPPVPEPPVEEPASQSIDLSAAALEAAVRGAMGISDSDDDEEISRDPIQVKEQLSAVRRLLQALDDVADYDLVEAVDEELYQLHKAVEYKLRNHKASEAKAQLNDLFK